MPRAESIGAVLPALAVRTAVCAGVAALALVPVTVSAAGTARARPDSRIVAEDLLLARAKPVAASRSLGLTPRQIAQRHVRARVRVVAYARAQRGKPYAYGATGPRSYDCSGLAMSTLRTVGIRLPRSSSAQARRGIRVSARNARPGDLVVWNGHVGILSGRWRMVDAPGRGRRVVERAIYRRPAPSFRRLIG